MLPGAFALHKLRAGAWKGWETVLMQVKPCSANRKNKNKKERKEKKELKHSQIKNSVYQAHEKQ